MADFNRDRPGGRFRKRFNDRGFKPNMHKAICSKCAKECEVPFRPTGAKPVYCSSCFDRPVSNKPFFQPQVQSSNTKYEEQFTLLNSKIDKILNILIPAAAEIEVAEVPEKEITLPQKPRVKKE